MCRPTNNSQLESSKPSKSACVTSNFTEFIVPTFRESSPKELDVSSLTSTSLVQLKKEDPFMYNSIPAVKEAKMLGRDEDVLAILSSCSDDEDESATANSKRSTVTRQQRLSTECHPDVFLADLFDSAELMASLEEEMDSLSLSSLASSLEGGDDLYDFLLGMQESQQ